jgi:hypothetical protein
MLAARRQAKAAQVKTKPRPLDIITMFDDERLFKPYFRGASWNGWRTVLKAIFALPMTEHERAFFRTIADREPPRMVVQGIVSRPTCEGQPALLPPEIESGLAS